MPGGEGIADLPDGKCRVKIEHGGEVLDVDEDAVEKVIFDIDFCSDYFSVSSSNNFLKSVIIAMTTFQPTWDFISSMIVL